MLLAAQYGHSEIVRVLSPCILLRPKLLPYIPLDFIDFFYNKLDCKKIDFLKLYLFAIIFSLIEINFWWKCDKSNAIKYFEL